jgi:hypothetical protein
MSSPAVRQRYQSPRYCIQTKDQPMSSITVWTTGCVLMGTLVAINTRKFEGARKTHKDTESR